MERSNFEAFLDAFVSIEMYLRHSVPCRANEPFGAVLARAASQNLVVRRFVDDLREYAELRNAIVHQRRGGEPIAEPHLRAVEDLQRIAAVVTDPPRIRGLGRMEVMVCAPDTTVHDAARTMYDGNFSQLPVYRDRQWVGLLTSEAITRWLASGYDGEDGSPGVQPVQSVLRFRESTSVEAFVDEDCAILEVVDLFEKTARRGKRLDAVLVTQHGNRHEHPLHILTLTDLPRLYRLGYSREASFAVADAVPT